MGDRAGPWEVTRNKRSVSVSATIGGDDEKEEKLSAKKQKTQEEKNQENYRKTFLKNIELTEKKEEKAYEKREKKEGFRRDQVDWPTVIDFLEEQKKISTRNTDHEFRDDDRDITKVGRKKDLSLPVESLGLNPLSKEVTSVENSLIKMYKNKTGESILPLAKEHESARQYSPEPPMQYNQEPSRPYNQEPARQYTQEPLMPVRQEPPRATYAQRRIPQPPKLPDFLTFGPRYPGHVPEPGVDTLRNSARIVDPPVEPLRPKSLPPYIPVELVTKAKPDPSLYQNFPGYNRLGTMGPTNGMPSLPSGLQLKGLPQKSEMSNTIYEQARYGHRPYGPPSGPVQLQSFSPSGNVGYY